jgi:hypothetical protein
VAGQTLRQTTSSDTNSVGAFSILGANMASTSVAEIIKKEERRNQEIGQAMLSNFSDKTRTALSDDFLGSVEQIIARHVEGFLDPMSAMAVASNITESLRGELTDMINETQDNAIRIVERYTNHFSLQIKQAIKNMNKET